MHLCDRNAVLECFSSVSKHKNLYIKNYLILIHLVKMCQPEELPGNWFNHTMLVVATSPNFAIVTFLSVSPFSKVA